MQFAHSAGYEAGGHRGIFDTRTQDTQLGTLALTRLLVAKQKLPVISAGGIMDGAGVSACLALGASAVQLGTAFVLCPESSATNAHRAALTGPAAESTVMSRVFTGRPARGMKQRYYGLQLEEVAAPEYPLPYHALKELAATPGGEGYGVQWAGQGAPLARALPAAELIKRIIDEMRIAMDQSYNK